MACCSKKKTMQFLVIFGFLIKPHYSPFNCIACNLQWIGEFSIQKLSTREKVKEPSTYCCPIIMPKTINYIATSTKPFVENWLFIICQLYRHLSMSTYRFLWLLCCALLSTTKWKRVYTTRERVCVEREKVKWSKWSVIMETDTWRDQEFAFYLAIWLNDWTKHFHTIDSHPMRLNKLIVFSINVRILFEFPLISMQL